MRVLIVAAPLSARSGVYRSTLDLVATARAGGHDWRAVVGVRAAASGNGSTAPGIAEHVVHERGRAVLPAVRALVEPHLHGVDTVITMVPQSDVAVCGMRTRPRHVAWVRGLPWPATGEQHPLRTAVIRHLERGALRRADAVWATSPLLATQLAGAVDATIVPAGVPLLARAHDGRFPGRLLWAGRISVEKGPREMLGIARRTGIQTDVYGEGPLLDELRAEGVPNVHWRGWADPSDIWSRSGIGMCTSHRDAFGRSPVEAASAGMPLVLSDQTGVAPFLYTDPELAEAFVLPVDAADAWDTAVTRLRDDEALRRRASDHVHANAKALSIESSFAAAQEQLE